MNSRESEPSICCVCVVCACACVCMVCVRVCVCVSEEGGVRTLDLLWVVCMHVYVCMGVRMWRRRVASRESEPLTRRGEGGRGVCVWYTSLVLVNWCVGYH